MMFGFYSFGLVWPFWGFLFYYFGLLLHRSCPSRCPSLSPDKEMQEARGGAPALASYYEAIAFMMIKTTISRKMRQQEWLGESCSLPVETCPSLSAFNFKDSAALKKINTETRVDRTKFGIHVFTFILLKYS